MAIASKTIKGITVEISGDTTKLLKSLSQVNTNSKDLQSELKKVNALLKFDPSNTDLLRQKQDILSQSIETTKEKLEKLKEAEKQVQDQVKKGEINEEQYRDFQREIINTEQKLQILEKEMRQFGSVAKQQLQNSLNKVGELGNKLENAGKKLKIVSATAAAGLVASAKSAIDFETAFTGVEKTVDGTTEQLEELKQGIRDMAKEIPSSTTEIANVAEAAGQLGIKTEDILSFTRVMIDLGNSTNLSANEAANALAKFANVTKMSKNDYDKLGSTIVALGNNFATTEQDIVNMATNLAATGELAGLSQPQILSLATAMSSVGIEAEAGGSAMSKLLKKIQVSVETGSEDLDKFAKVAGMTSKDFKKAFEKDAVKALSLFISGLNDTERNGKSAISILNDMGLTEVRLSNTILSLANSSDLLNDAINLGNKAWKENTALTNEASKRYTTTSSKIQITMNKIKDVGISIGNKLLPKIEEVLNIVDKGLTKLGSLDDKTHGLISNVGIVVACLAPVLTIGGKLLTGINKLGMGLINLPNNFGKVKKSLDSLKTTLAAHPIMTLVAVISAIAIATESWMDANDKVGKKIEEEKEKIDEQTRAVRDNANAWKDSVNSRIETINSSTEEFSYYHQLFDELQKITDKNGDINSGYETRAQFIATTLSEALGIEIKLVDGQIEKYDELKDTFDKLIEKKKALIILDSQENMYKEAISNKSSILQSANNTLEQIEKAKEKYQAILIESQNAVNQINPELRKRYQEYLNNQQGVIDGLNSQYEDYMNTYNGYLTTIGMYEQNYVSFQKGNYNEMLVTEHDYIARKAELGELAENEIKTEIDKTQNHLQYLRELKQKYNTDIYDEEIANNEKNLKLLEDSLNNQKEIIEKGISDTTDTWVTDLQNQLSEISNKRYEFKNVGNGLMQMYIDGIKVGEPELETKMHEIAQKTVDETKKEKNNAKIAGENLLDGTKEGISNKSKQNSIFTAVSNFGNSILAKLKSSLKEHSPSKASEDMGINLLKGIPIGVNKEKSNVLGNISDFGAEVLESLQNELNDDIQIDSTFNGTKNLMINALTNSNSTKSIDSTAKDLQSLTDLMNKYMPQILNNIGRDIVMDGKKLSKTIAPEINKELGILSSKEQRGY